MAQVVRAVIGNGTWLKRHSSSIGVGMWLKWALATAQEVRAVVGNGIWPKRLKCIGPWSAGRPVAGHSLQARRAQPN
eukprot:2459408-Alexandrium_andersonii.AAC.1